MFSSDGVADTTNYVDDVFSTYTYKCTGVSTQITTNINTLNNNSLIWLSGRDHANGNYFIDNVINNIPGASTKYLKSESTYSLTTATSNLLDFTNVGFNLSASTVINNTILSNYVAWTFRKKTDFFDIVTYTGNGTSQAISHNLNSIPGAIIIKALDATSDWQMYHSSLGSSQRIDFNRSAMASSAGTAWNSTTPTDTNFYVGSSIVNSAGVNYIAYVFANNSSTDGMIKCGSYTGATTISLGWEPQWLLIKNISNSGDWFVLDTTRGLFQYSKSNDQDQVILRSNTATGESNVCGPYTTTNGFVVPSAATDFSNGSYIYIAIRKSNKIPTSGGDVFAPITYTGNTDYNKINTPFSPDLIITANRDYSYNPYFQTRFTNGYVITSSSGSQNTPYTAKFDTSNSIIFSAQSLNGNYSGYKHILHAFKRANGFFETVIYAGNGTAKTIQHTLNAKPQLIIVKSIEYLANYGWPIYVESLGATKVLKLASTAAAVTSSGYWDNTEPTSTTFRVGSDINVNESPSRYIAYLFASVPGISKVFSYTGNGTSQTIDCGFTTGARFILIKRTDSTGDWYVWDSARGIVSGNDPHLSLNTSSAEVSTDDSIDPDTTGFIVNQVAATNINVSAGTYIGLAIA